jgi:hypothetical protein
MYRSAQVPALSVLLLAAPAIADDTESGAAALFAKARVLVEAGDYAKACPIFEVSLELEPALGTELNLAQCWTEIGRYVDALALYEGLVVKTEAANQPQRLALAREGVEKLSKRVAEIALDVVGMVGAKVSVDGRAVDDTSPVRVDPGEHAIEAVDIAGRTVRTTVHVVEGERRDVALVAPPDPKPRHPHRKLVLGLAAGGGAAVIVGSVVGIAFLVKRADAIERCEQTPDALVCDQQGLDMLDSARALSYATTTFYVAAIGLAGAAAYVHYRWRGDSRAVLRPAVTTDSVGLAIETRW